MSRTNRNRSHIQGEFVYTCVRIEPPSEEEPLGVAMVYGGSTKDYHERRRFHHRRGYEMVDAHRVDSGRTQAEIANIHFLEMQELDGEPFTCTNDKFSLKKFFGL